MRLAICSDIHGNLAALEAVLADMRACAPDRIIVAGDLLYGGPRPLEVLARLRSTPDLTCVMGNCDHYIADPADRSAEAIWARERLSAEELAFLGGLPLTITIDAAPGQQLLVCHANPQNLEDPIKPDTPELLVRPLLAGVMANLVAFGHYHVPFVRAMPPWTLLDVSSAGLPMDGDRRGVWALVEWAPGGWRIEHRRVTYDWDAVARDLVAVRFPHAERAAERLLRARY